MRSANAPGHRRIDGDFNTLFKELSETWESHQKLRGANTPIGDLARSNAFLFQTRMAMGSWHRNARC